MKKEEQKTQSKVGSPQGKKVKVRITIILFSLVIVAAFLVWKFSSPDAKTFTLRKKENDNNKIIIYGLDNGEIDKMDWQRGAEFSDYYHAENFQYRLYGEGKSFLNWLLGNPTIYSAVSPLAEHEIRNKEIEFEGTQGRTGIRIPKTKPSIRYDVFAKEGWTLINLFVYVFYAISIIISLYVIDTIFGTNICGFLSYPFRAWRNEGGITNIPRIGFKDIGGLHEAKEELGEIVSYFRNPQLFWQRGAKVPKGVLLVGPPGNGKTLLAKALAGECNLPFLARSGSEFEEMVVGMGARRVRDLFRQARNFNQGCIIFIDEIDSVGRKRYSSNSNHAELTLNQLLSELDGFHSRDNVIILAATNSLKVLDNALLRPGRFDRQIYIPLPNLKGRREIIALHAQKLILQPGLDLEEFVSMTRGLSGAQIVNIFNEASILSIRYGRKSIDQEIIFEAYDRVLMGPSLTSQTITPEKRRIVAFHEAGHAIVGLSLPETVVKKITIIPRLSAGGYTWIDLYGEEGDDYLLNKSQMLAHVMSFLGGRASEELIFGLDYITMGAYDDFKKASTIIRELILNYGMSDLGIIPMQESFFFGEGIPPELPEITKQKIENEREKILNQCWKKVKSILRQKRKTLKLLAEILLQKNSLQKEEINYIFVNQISPYTPLLGKINRNEKEK